MCISLPDKEHSDFTIDTVPWNQTVRLTAFYLSSSLFSADEGKLLLFHCSERTIDTPPNLNTTEKNSPWMIKTKTRQANAAFNMTVKF